jgi:tripartite-type tricarboxylate transporter receptor subunit TctC
MTTVKLPRRNFLHLAASAAALPVLPRSARAQAYPARPIRFIVGFAAGGAVDLSARLIGQALSDRIGQPVIIENRPGAASSIATDLVVKSAPDGYTMLFIGVHNAISATLNDKLSYDFVRDIAPVAPFMRLPNVMEVGPLVPVKTVPEFIEYARTNVGNVSYASSGIGTSVQMSAELFKLLTKVDLIHVPYTRGLAAGGYADLMSGRVHVLFDNIPGSIELIRTGKLRALAVTTSTRSDALPDVPALSEFVPGYEASVWYGIGVARNTPIEIINRLNVEVNATIADAKLKSRFADLGATVFSGSPADFGNFIAADIEKWAKVIRAAGIKAE